MNKSIPIYGSDGSMYKSISHLASSIGASKCHIVEDINSKGFTIRDNVTYSSTRPSAVATPKEVKKDKEYEEYLESKKIESLPFTKFEFNGQSKSADQRYAVALFSDAHIEETVTPDSVLGLNEYDPDIAAKRIEKYFTNLAICLNVDKIDSLIFASLGDTISGYIHEELAQCNGLSPIEATLLAQNLLYSGLEYLCSNTSLSSITFIGIVGNHSRITMKIQHSNGYKMSYEWMMYKNIEKQCKVKGLPIEFCIPNSEIALLDMPDGNRFLFIHGYQLKSSGTGTVCGIYPALNRLCMKWDKTFKQTKVFLGHFHSCISLPNAMVNGSIIGYNSYSLSNAFTYEEPSQMYCAYDPMIGELLTRKIYCK